MRVRFLAIVLLAPVVMMMGCAREAPITVLLENNSGRAIQSVAASYTGGVASFGPLGVDESQEVGIRPTGDSHIELEIQPANGQAEHRVVDTYFGRGYRGKIRITLDSEFAVRVSTTLTP
ncbi:MAG TPA: hypothetical protein VIW92_05690 [Thermoanaerobaculia bacterium]